MNWLSGKKAVWIVVDDVPYGTGNGDEGLLDAMRTEMAAAARKVAMEHVNPNRMPPPQCFTTSGTADADALEIKVRVK